MTYRSGLQDALLAERDLYARELAAVREASPRGDERDALATAIERARPWLLTVTTDVAAAGRLTRRVTEVGQTVGVLVQEVRVVDAESLSTLTATSVAVRALGDLEGLVRFLHTLETDEQLLRVHGLTLRAAGVNDGDLERGQLMSAGFVVTGYWRATSEQPVEAEGQGP
jgi:hypothetical protein